MPSTRSGCLRALDELIDRSILDLDLYVGISGGAFVASLIAAGVSPREMYDEATNRTRTPFGIAAAPIYHLGPSEYVKRYARAPKLLREAAGHGAGRRRPQPRRPRAARRSSFSRRA